MKRATAENCIWAAVVAGLACGCASVKVYKVDVDAQGEEEVNKSVEGVPYYMPRPYLAGVISSGLGNGLRRLGISLSD